MSDHIASARARDAYNSVCAKLGMPDALRASASGTLAELHDSRKAVRRLINKITENGVTVDDLDLESNYAIAHATNLVERIGAMINRLGDVEGAPGTRRELRTAADIRAHYRNTGTAEKFSLGEFLRGVAGMSAPAEVRNALAEGVDTGGGYLLPSVVMPGILEALVPQSSLLQAGAALLPVDVGAKTYTMAGVQSVPAAAWRTEGGNVAESDPLFRGIVAQPKSLSFFFKVSRELLADAANVTDALLHAIAQAMAVGLDAAGLRGSGTAPVPCGILNTAGVQSVTNGANGAQISSFGSVLSAYQAIISANAPAPTAAIMHPRSLLQFAGLQDTLGQPLRRPDIIQNMKFVPTSQVPINLTVGSSADCSEIYVGDFSGVRFIIRERMSVLLSDQLYAGTGQIGFFCHSRADVVVEYPQALAVITGVR